jgi:murein DD-endopeptidase MepM/ murein hydrolase activator NlpD
MNNKYWYLAGTGLLIYLIMGTQKSFANIVYNQKTRLCDAFGCGYFGASRGTRSHNGIDIVTNPNQVINSPINGTVTRFPFPYGSDLSYTGIQIENNDYLVKIFYVTPTVKVNTKVTQGQQIAISQNIAAKYGSGMTNHVHIEAYTKKTNKLIDVSKLF